MLVTSILGAMPNFECRYVATAGQLKDYIQALKKLGLDQVVLCFGAFDLLDVRQMQWLETASKLGSLLVVGVESDELAEKRVGRKPKIPMIERVRTLAHQHGVGLITPITSAVHQLAVLRAARPETLVVADAAAASAISPAARKYCGQVTVQELPEGVSLAARLQDNQSRLIQEIVSRLSLHLPQLFKQILMDIQAEEDNYRRGV